MSEIVGVSACLIGIRCRWDGEIKSRVNVQKVLAKSDFIAVCPEILGGLDVPRPSAELRGGDGEAALSGEAEVISENGENVSEAFMKGAKKAFRKLEKHGVIKVILKENSPSCGLKRAWIDGEKREGCGVFAALLKSQGFILSTEEDY